VAAKLGSCASRTGKKIASRRRDLTRDKNGGFNSLSQSAPKLYFPLLFSSSLPATKEDFYFNRTRSSIHLAFGLPLPLPYPKPTQLCHFQNINYTINFFNRQTINKIIVPIVFTHLFALHSTTPLPGKQFEIHETPRTYQPHRTNWRAPRRSPLSVGLYLHVVS
jgi:hypothetical protein